MQMMTNKTRTKRIKTGHRIFPPTKHVADRIPIDTAVIQ
jgi:hypothetical protein